MALTPPQPIDHSPFLPRVYAPYSLRQICPTKQPPAMTTNRYPWLYKVILSLKKCWETNNNNPSHFPIIHYHPSSSIMTHHHPSSFIIHHQHTHLALSSMPASYISSGKTWNGTAIPPTSWSRRLSQGEVAKKPTKVLLSWLLLSVQQATTIWGGMRHVSFLIEVLIWKHKLTPLKISHFLIETFVCAKKNTILTSKAQV